MISDPHLTAPPETVWLDVADRIGSRLCRDALWAGNRCNWIGPSMEPTGSRWEVVHRALGPDLYAGTAGIGLFLSLLHRASGLAAHRRYAEASLRQALTSIDVAPPHSEASVYAGRLGTALAVLYAGDALNESHFVDVAREHVCRAAAAPPAPGCIDVIAGSAGCIPALLRAHERFGDEILLAGARQHGEQLLATAQSGPFGCSWDTLPGSTMANLTGFAHGTAGIAWALLELSAVTGEQRYRDAAASAIQYEQHYFDATENNWLDLRDHSQSGGSNDRPIYGLAWCHGSPGIGRSRLRVWELTDEHAYQQHAEAALRSTAMALQRVRPGDAIDYTYCHGLAGLAEFLLESKHQAGAVDMSGTIALIFGAAGQRFELGNLPWPCGVPGAGESPGLMLGVAGIGLLHLRLSGCETPDVLMLGRGRAAPGKNGPCDSKPPAHQALGDVPPRASSRGPHY